MEEIQLGDDVIKQIKDFDPWTYLTNEQKSLINELILNKDLKARYRKYDLCKECMQPNTGGNLWKWCQSCNAKKFERNFENWTSGNHDIDEFIKKTQLKAKNEYEVIEWIEYDKFKNIEYLAKGGSGIIYKANWIDGYIVSWNYKNNRWKRGYQGGHVALKCLHNSPNLTAKFLREVR